MAPATWRGGQRCGFCLKIDANEAERLWQVALQQVQVNFFRSTAKLHKILGVPDNNNANSRLQIHFFCSFNVVCEWFCSYQHWIDPVQGTRRSKKHIGRCTKPKINHQSTCTHTRTIGHQIKWKKKRQPTNMNMMDKKMIHELTRDTLKKTVSRIADRMKKPFIANRNGWKCRWSIVETQYFCLSYRGVCGAQVRMFV